MTFKVDKSEIPLASEITKILPNAYYADSYSYNTDRSKRTALQIWIEQVSTLPNWVNFLMACRNNIVSMLGLKHLGHIGDFDGEKQLNDYKVGDRIGIFTLLFLSDDEIILADSDKHLDVQLSVYKSGGDLIAISTVVHVHNFLGRLYMLFVTPLHKIIVQACIVRAESR